MQRGEQKKGRMGKTKERESGKWKKGRRPKTCPGYQRFLSRTFEEQSPGPEPSKENRRHLNSRMFESARKASVAQGIQTEEGDEWERSRREGVREIGEG